MRMNPKIRTAWVERLRSGKYPQARSYLHVEGDGFCCLGVLCELAVEAGVVRRQTIMGDDDFQVTSYVAVDLPQDSSERVLPQAVAMWAGIEDTETAENPNVYSITRDGDDEDDETVTSSHGLADLNDDWEWNFDMIADAIEADARRNP